MGKLTLLLSKSYLSRSLQVSSSLRPSLRVLFSFLFFSLLFQPSKMADNVINCLENMKLTTDEEEVIANPDEGREVELKAII